MTLQFVPSDEVARIRNRLDHQLRLQPHRQLRGGGRGGRPLAVLRPGSPAVPRAALRLPGGWRGLGLQPVLRHPRPLHGKLNPFGARLPAIFASDIGHWDVPDFRHVLPEAYELVGDGLFSEEDFKAFVFSNPVSLWAGGNPAFFAGTAVEASVDKHLSATG
jgi:hypothetical protein